MIHTRVSPVDEVFVRNAVGTSESPGGNSTKDLYIAASGPPSCRHPKPRCKRTNLRTLRAPCLRHAENGTLFIGEFSLVILRLGGFLWGIFPAGILPSHTSTPWSHSLFDRKWNEGTVSASGVDVFLEKASTWTGPHMHLAITVAHFSISQNAQRFSEGFFFKHA